MAKKIILACMAVVAFAAFVLPATAMAANEPQLLENGTPVPVETGGVKTKIKATQVGTSTLRTTGGTALFHCASGEMTGEITSNTVGNVQGKITAAAFSGTATGGDCTGTSAVLGLPAKVTPKVSAAEPWCLSSTNLMAEREFQVTKCGGGKVTFVMDVTGLGECKYESTGAIVGTYTTNTTGDAVLTVDQPFPNSTTQGFTLEAGSAAGCTSSGIIEMTYTLETDISETKPLEIS